MLDQSITSSQPKRRQPHRYVYFIEDPDRMLIKIGITTQLWTRLAALRITFPNAHYLGTIHGWARLERVLHRHFATTRTEGEWFRPTVEMMEFIAQTALPVNDRSREAVEAMQGHVPNFTVRKLRTPTNPHLPSPTRKERLARAAAMLAGRPTPVDLPAPAHQSYPEILASGWVWKKKELVLSRLAEGVTDAEALAREFKLALATIHEIIESASPTP